VIGPVASGKSTLARYLGSRLALPVVELDELYWASDRTFTDDEWPAIHRRLLEPERWIIAGDYRAVAADRLAAADLVVWLDLPRPLCWWRACRRRSTVPRVACLRWIWRYPAHGRRQTVASLKEVGSGTVVLRLRSRRAVRALVTEVARMALPATHGPCATS
jgi:adenylate kinase family enzyme